MGKLIFLLSLFAGSIQAFAQHSGEPIWLDADGTFSALTYQDGTHTQKAQLAGVRGEFGMAAFGIVGISVGASYADGHTDYSGTDLAGATHNSITTDYFSDYRAMAHFMYSGVELAGGLAQSEWFDNNGSYRERQKFTYLPVTLTISNKIVYLKLEGDKVSKGNITATTADLGGGATDIELQQNSGTGYGAELGVMIPSSMRIDTRVFVNYHHWDLDPSTTASDGVTTSMSIGKTSITTLTAGVGLGF